MIGRGFGSRSGGGLLTVGLYFMDVASDIGVCVQLFATGNPRWGSTSAVFLVLQYIVVYQRAYAYLKVIHNADNPVTVAFLRFGFPIGILGLDFLMFAEPFDLLLILPLPREIREFMPACTPPRAARTRGPGCAARAAARRRPRAPRLSLRLTRAKNGRPGAAQTSACARSSRFFSRASRSASYRRSSSL